MFIVWEDGGRKTPYVPGSLRGRRVEKVQRSASVQRPEPHGQDVRTQLSQADTSRAAEAYRQSESSPKSRKPAILAKQIMSSPVLTLTPTSQLSDAWGIIQRKRFRHIPVLSAQGHLVGILSDRDVFRATLEIVTSPDQVKDQDHGKLIQQIMVKTVLSAAPETEIRTIARVLFEERVGAMPIVAEQGELVGMLTRSDILRTVVNEAPFELWI